MATEEVYHARRSSRQAQVIHHTTDRTRKGDRGEMSDTKPVPVVRMFDIEKWANLILPDCTNTDNFMSRVKDSRIAHYPKNKS